LTTAAGVDIEPIWATLLAKALEGKNIKEMLSTIGVGSAAAPTGTASAVQVKDAPVETVEAAPDDGDGSDDDDGMVSSRLFMFGWIIHEFPFQVHGWLVRLNKRLGSITSSAVVLELLGQIHLALAPASCSARSPSSFR
jgi:ribosomal protein L12E/L44/L45/RPP1/RPP2